MYQTFQYGNFSFVFPAHKFLKNKAKLIHQSPEMFKSISEQFVDLPSLCHFYSSMLLGLLHNLVMCYILLAFHPPSGGRPVPRQSESSTAVQASTRVPLPETAAFGCFVVEEILLILVSRSSPASCLEASSTVEDSAWLGRQLSCRVSLALSFCLLSCCARQTFSA